MSDTFDFSVDDSYSPNQNYDDTELNFDYGDMGGNYDFGDGSSYNVFNTPEMNSGIPNNWGAGGYQMGGDGTQFWQDQAGNYTGYQLPGGEYTPYEQGGGWPDMGSIGSTLQSLFSNKAVTGGLAALIEGSQNKKKAAALQQLASQVRQGSDPFGAQRPFYQQQLQQAVQSPYSSPIVANQVSQLERVQAMKDAAAGRRSNSALSNPATLAAASEVAQKYMNSLMTPAGAELKPDNSTWSSLAAEGTNAGINGYLSPLISALGIDQRSSTNTDALVSALQKALSGRK